MSLMLGILSGVACSVVVGLLVADVRAWLVRGSRKIVALAARLLPEPHRSRYAEEWQADLLAIEDSPLSVIVLALWTAVRAPRWAARLRSADAGAGEAPAKAEGVLPEVAPRARGELNPSYTFARFIAGEGNRFAHAAALAVADAPSEAYNPLLLHGPPGLGKTHLLVAITQFLRAKAPDLNVRYVTAESFVNEFVEALRSANGGKFKGRYRDLDVLLVDDIQFLEGKPHTEEEFFHTFNALYEGGSQVVLSADRVPGQLSAFAERLRDRFEWGLTVAVEPPDLSNRIAVLKSLLREVDLPDEDGAALSELARRVNANFRQLHGALTKVIAHSSITARPLDSKLIEELIPEPRPRRTLNPVEEIQQYVAAAFGVSCVNLVGPSRKARPLLARQVAILLTHESSGLSLPQIGRLYGGRDHSTVLNSLRRIEASIAVDPVLAERVRCLRAELSKLDGF